jgi:hypothetical protein
MPGNELRQRFVLFYFFSPEINEAITWILHESEGFICKALKGDVVVFNFEPLITQQMKASGSPALLGRSSKSEAQRVKINEINRRSSSLPIRYFALLLKASQPIVIKYYSNFSLIFMHDSGIT